MDINMKKMNCMFSLYNESEMKREENAFLQLYIVTCNKKFKQTVYLNIHMK